MTSAPVASWIQPMATEVSRPPEKARTMRSVTGAPSRVVRGSGVGAAGAHPGHEGGDRKSTRLNSSHVSISYAVFCLKKKIPSAAGPAAQEGRDAVCPPGVDE